MALKNKIGIIRGALSELSSEESFLNELPALTSDLFKSKFDPYIEAEDKFAAMTCCHSHLGGAGWDLPGDIGVYCLNSALCSFAGLNDPKTGEKIIDKELLSIDTRTLYQ